MSVSLRCPQGAPYFGLHRVSLENPPEAKDCSTSLSGNTVAYNELLQRSNWTDRSESLPPRVCAAVSGLISLFLDSVVSDSHVFLQL